MTYNKNTNNYYPRQYNANDGQELGGVVFCGFLYNVGMTRLNTEQLTQLQSLAISASELAMTYYQNDYEITIKSDDSPVTQADFAVSALLERELPRIANFPVLSEENTPPNQAWLQWQTYWLIDPIDGTKHFINRTGEFCICIALIHQHNTVLGLVSAPVTQTLWLAQRESDLVPTLLHKSVGEKIVDFPASTPERLTVTSNATDVTHKIKTLAKNLPHFDFYRRGSALKFIDVAEGNANLYPKIGDTCEWDSAAAHCILRAAGGEVIRFTDGYPLRYGQRTSLLNPHFLAYRHLDDALIASLLKNYQRL